MPAVSKAQRKLMGLAEHHPSEVSKKNRGVLKMSKGQLHDFAATKEKKLPQYKRRKPRKTDTNAFIAGRRV
jgi:hypothetical protein